jgi:DNA ligase (NAD+)
MLLKEVTREKPEAIEGADSLKGLTFVITGDLNRFANRNELKALIEAHGGKVAGSVSKKTECLINNDITSSSSKNVSAKKNGVKILTEDEFLAEYMNS